MIALVGAAAYATRPIGELSGGEQQRLLIAQTLAAGPELLLLDEPLDSLDLPNQTAVSALLARICRSEHVAVLLVAHDVNPLLADLDRVVYIAGGRIVSGKPEDVITSETLSALYGVPIEVLRTSDGRLVVVGQPEAPRPPLARPRTPHLIGPSCDYPFMVNALEAGTIVALMAAVAGWFMVLRRQSFAGHTLSVMSFPGRERRRARGNPARARLLRLVLGRRARDRGGLARRCGRDRQQESAVDRHGAGGRARARLPLPQPLQRRAREPRDAALRLLPRDHRTTRC